MYKLLANVNDRVVQSFISQHLIFNAHTTQTILKKMFKFIETFKE